MWTWSHQVGLTIWVEAKHCAGVKFLWSVKHILWRGPNVACDTSHPITLPYRWPAAYVCRVHHWIPNQTLSGVITVWAPNPLWSLALSHSPTINLMLQPHSSRSAMHYCKHVLCPKDAFIPGSPAHPPPPPPPQRLRARDNPAALLPRTSEPQLQR